VTERVVTIEGRRVRVGTFADAGRLCVTDRSPNGVSGHRYREYQSGTASFIEAAPPPIMVSDPHDPTGPKVPYRDADGNLQVDLGAVAAWNRRRRGQGGWQPPTSVEDLRRTPFLERLLVAARDGVLSVRPGVKRGWQVYVGDEKLPPQRAGQMLSALVRVGAVEAPDPEVRERQFLPLAAAGRGVLTRWGANHPKA
jgi:hypothetical protein